MWSRSGTKAEPSIIRLSEASAPLFEAKTPFARLMQKHVEKTARSNKKPLSLEDVRRQVRKLRGRG